VRFLLRIVLLNLFYLLLCAQVIVLPSAQSKDSSSTLDEQEIVATPQGIRIQLKNRTLHEVLQHVDHISGIHFSLSETMKEVPITMTFEAPDWPTAIRQLLQTFSTVEVWSESSTQLRQVFIIKRSEVQALPNETKDPSEDASQKSEDAYLLGAPPASSLPPPPPPPSFPPPYDLEIRENRLENFLTAQNSYWEPFQRD